MRKKPFNATEFFELIKDILVERQQLPVILDYALASKDAVTYELKSCEFETTMDIRYGGSEGIYVTVYIEGWFDDSDKIAKIRIGTFKTLHESEDAFRMMALLGANFILAAKEYVRKKQLEFEWIGFFLKATPNTEDSPKLGGLYMVDIQDAFQKKLDWERKYPDYTVKLLNLETREYV